MAAKQPAPETPRASLPPVEERVLARLRGLAGHAPQSLVIEAGCAPDREAAALAWAKALNCGERGCGVCPLCRQIDGRAFRDLLIIDKAFFDDGDKSRSGTDKIRDLLPVWGQPPHGEGKRVSIFIDAHELHQSVANLLLKTLEEPRPGNAFVLLAPQRERLLQTLVSRSFVLTLPWPGPAAPAPDAAEWIDALLRFWDSGQGWFERTGVKGSLDRALAQRVLLGLERELILAHGARPAEDSPAARRLARLGPAGLRRLDLAVAQAQEALTQPTAPAALVLDWLAATVLVGGQGKSPSRGPRGD